ncbi:MAG TPA: glycosyltransferase family 39 protein [Thermoanaerobaculia bacterium]|jgi:hypothetical protein|nr:glycosyltransferase family 39 protein [Thermoanaerobaculia bacterium]
MAARELSTQRRSDLLLGCIALAGVGLHLLCLRSYGWFRDEFYYVVCGRHLDFGYVDHPPFVALVARLVTAVFGDSLVALRLVSALTGAVVIYLTGRLARELGGGLFAQGLAALCVLIVPVYLFSFHIFSMNVFDLLFWTLGTLVVARIVKTGNPKLWLLFGVVAGLGLENKHSMLFFGLGVFVGVLLTPERRALRSPWIWLGGAVAALLFLPNILWEVAHGWPTLEFIRNAEAHKNVAFSPLAFLAEQVRQMHPLTLPVWLSGLGWLLFSRQGRTFRPLGWIYVTALAVLLTQHSKPYYLAPAYPVLFAAGGTAIEGRLARLHQAWLRPALAGTIVLLLVAGGALTAPLVLPVLPIESFLRYQSVLGLRPGSDERHRMGDLPQYFADMHGWPEMVAEVARVHRTLTPAEQARATVFGQNYGEAGAVDVLGRAYGLPGAISGHNSYFLWGPPEESRNVIIVIGGDEEDNRAVCADLQRAGEIRCGRCMPYEDRDPVYVCRGLKMPVRELWPRVRHYE